MRCSKFLWIFANTESISKKYELTAKTGEDLSTYSTGEMDPKMIMLDNKMKGLVIQRQKKGRFLKLASWALYYRSTLKDLLEQIVSLIDEIERLFPAPQAQNTFVQQEATEIGDKQSLKLVENGATNVDGLLQKKVKEVIAGHQYSNIRIKGQAHTGDVYGSDWVEGAIGAPHKFDVVEVEDGGKALVGNKYGGKDFWG